MSFRKQDRNNRLMYHIRIGDSLTKSNHLLTTTRNSQHSYDCIPLLFHSTGPLQNLGPWQIILYSLMPSLS